MTDYVSSYGDFDNDIDHDVLQSQQTGDTSQNTSQPSQSSNDDDLYSNKPLVSSPNNNAKTVNTFLGNMPTHLFSDKNSPEYQHEISKIIGAALGAPGMKMIGEEALPIIKSGINKSVDYLNPGNSAEQFRSTLGEGTSSQNIENLSKRAQFAKQSRQQEALIPKNQIYSQEGGSQVYDIPESSLPEGNIPSLAEMIAPGQKYGEDEARSLSKALGNYRKTGNVNDFLDESENIFNVPELPEKAASKIEDALSMPTARDSKYFSDPDVTSAYSKKGNLMNLHNAYEDNPILNNYDALQSALKKELRAAEGRAKLTDSAVPKVEQLTSNIKNLNSDKDAFMGTLPENMQNLENDFRSKYQDYAQTYKKGQKETGASLTLRRLAEGRHDLVKDTDVGRLFSNPTAADKAAILDMGEGAARNAIYSALQKVPEGDAEGMANTILDLHRTKGFDKIITPEFTNWAENMLNHVRKVNYIKKGLGMAGGAAAGSALFGSLGGALGATLPFAKPLGKHVINYLKK